MITGVARASEAASSATTELNIRSQTGSASSSVAEGSQPSGILADDLVQAQSSLPRSLTGRLSSRSAASSQTASPNKTSRGSMRMASGDEDWENILNDPFSPRKQRGKRKTASVQRDTSYNEMPSPLSLAAPTNASVGTSSNRPPGMSFASSRRSVSFESKSSYASKRERNSDAGLNKSEEGNKVSTSDGSRSPVVSRTVFGTSPPLSTAGEVVDVAGAKVLPSKEAVESTTAETKDELPDFTSTDLEPEPDVPAFLSGWDGATGWGDELDLDDDEDEAIGDTWLDDISSPDPLKIEEKIEEPVQSHRESVITEVKEVGKPEVAETFSDTSAPVLRAEECVISRPKASSIADISGEQEVSVAVAAAVLEKQHRDELAEQQSTTADINSSGVIVDAPEMTKALPTEESQPSTFSGVESSSEKTQSRQHTPVVTPTGEQGAKMHKDAAENAFEAVPVHGSAPEPDAWPMDSGVREEPADTPQVSNEETSSAWGAEHPEVEAGENSHFSVLVNTSDTAAEDSGVPSRAEEEHERNARIEKLAEPSTQAVVVDASSTEWDSGSVPHKNEESIVHAQHLPSTENQDEFQIGEDVPRFGADAWTRDVSCEKSEAVENVASNTHQVEEMGRADNVPEAKLEVAQTPVEQLLFSGLEPQTADVVHATDSELMPKTDSASAKRLQAAPVQVSSTQQSSNQLSFPASEWNWSGPVDTEAAADNDFFCSDRYRYLLKRWQGEQAWAGEAAYCRLQT